MRTIRIIASALAAVLFTAACDGGHKVPDIPRTEPGVLVPDPPVDNPPEDDPPGDDTPEDNGLLRHIRIVAMANPFNGSGGQWRLLKEEGLARDYTAQDVLEIISDLKPHRIERLLTGYYDPETLVPVREGEPPMKLLEFLNKACAAGAPGCDIAPKLNLNWLDESSPNQNAFFWESAQKLYDMQLDQPIRCINLDCWNNYVEDICTSAAERSKLFKRLRDIGYTEIGVNMTGHVNDNDPEIDYVVFTLKKDVWMPNETALDRVKGWTNIKHIFMYIDYPEPFTTFFTEKTPDEQADVYVKNIYPNQRPMGFIYAWPILQGAWDATAHKTREDGKYGGKTIYDIFKELMYKCD